MKMIKTLGLTLAAAGLMAITAQAVPITGSISIAAWGSTVTIDKSLNTVGVIDTAPQTPGNAVVNSATGDFGIFFGEYVQYANFSYDPLLVTNPIWDKVTFLYSLGSVSFDLLTITSFDEVGVGLVLAGTGIIKASGYEDTRGLWSFSADSTGSAGAANFTFSSQTSARVPDAGASLALLGMGLMGLVAFRRNRA